MVFFPVSATISDKLGRRKCMFVGAWIIVLGAILTSTANTYAQFVVGRFVLGCGIQVMVVAAPAYAVEIAPPLWRGRAVGELLVPKDVYWKLINAKDFTTADGSEGQFPLQLLLLEPTTSPTTIHGVYLSSYSVLPA